MSYWYDNKHRLNPDMVFQTKDGNIVKLERGVPGDASKWVVSNLSKSGWSYYDDEVEAADLETWIP